MATLLSRIFGKKTVEPAAPVKNDYNLDVRALKPLIQSKPATSADPKDLSGNWTMQQVTSVFPSAQRALFQKYHVGGCSSCGFQPTDTLAAVASGHGLDVNEVVEFVKRSQEMEKDIEITAQETAELLKQGKIKSSHTSFFHSPWSSSRFSITIGTRKCASSMRTRARKAS